MLDNNIITLYNIIYKDNLWETELAKREGQKEDEEIR